MTNQRRRRLAHCMNICMPFVLDATGCILLSVSAMLLHVVAGFTALGLSVFYMNHRIYGGRQ